LRPHHEPDILGVEREVGVDDSPTVPDSEADVKDY
jgi:hypothetical protein